MIPINSGKNKDEILKNRFTAYLTSAVQHRRIDYIEEQANRKAICELLEKVYYPESFDLEHEALKNMPLFIKMENEALLAVLMELGDRELYILLKHILDDSSLEELADILELSYKGTAAAYYRVVKKVRRKLKEVKK